MNEDRMGSAVDIREKIDLIQSLLLVKRALPVSRATTEVAPSCEWVIMSVGARAARGAHPDPDMPVSLTIGDKVMLQCDWRLLTNDNWAHRASSALAFIVTHTKAAPFLDATAVKRLQALLLPDGMGDRLQIPLLAPEGARVSVEGPEGIVVDLYGFRLRPVT